MSSKWLILGALALLSEAQDDQPEQAKFMSWFFQHGFTPSPCVSVYTNLEHYYFESGYDTFGSGSKYLYSGSYGWDENRIFFRSSSVIGLDPTFNSCSQINWIEFGVGLNDYTEKDPNFWYFENDNAFQATANLIYDDVCDKPSALGFEPKDSSVEEQFDAVNKLFRFFYYYTEVYEDYNEDLSESEYFWLYRLFHDIFYKDKTSDWCAGYFYLYTREAYYYFEYTKSSSFAYYFWLMEDPYFYWNIYSIWHTSATFDYSGELAVAYLLVIAGSLQLM